MLFTGSFVPKCPLSGRFAAGVMPLAATVAESLAYCWYALTGTRTAGLTVQGGRNSQGWGPAPVSGETIAHVAGEPVLASFLAA